MSRVYLMSPRNGVILRKCTWNDQASLSKRALDLLLPEAVGWLEGLAEYLSEAPSIICLKHPECTEGGFATQLRFRGFCAANVASSRRALFNVTSSAANGYKPACAHAPPQ